jgi:phage shock protein C
MDKKKRLTKDQESAVVSGVISGMAKYFGQDPVLFRILAIIFMIITGFFPFILFYILAWFVMPRDTGVDYEVIG